VTSGAYVAFAGIDGAGKSTQAGFLAAYLAKRGWHSYCFEGKEDFVVETMRAIAHREGFAGPRAFFGNEGTDLAKAFDTLRDYTHMIAPLVASGCIVIQPRSGYCRVALAAAMGSTNITQVEAVTHFGGEPDLTIWIDCSVDVALSRIEARGTDHESPLVLTRFRDRLIALSRRYEWHRVDGDAKHSVVRHAVRAIADEWLERNGRASRAPTGVV